MTIKHTTPFTAKLRTRPIIPVRVFVAIASFFVVSDLFQMELRHEKLRKLHFQQVEQERQARLSAEEARVWQAQAAQRTVTRAQMHRLHVGMEIRDVLSIAGPYFSVRGNSQHRIYTWRNTNGSFLEADFAEGIMQSMSSRNLP